MSTEAELNPMATAANQDVIRQQGVLKSWGEQPTPSPLETEMGNLQSAPSAETKARVDASGMNWFERNKAYALDEWNAFKDSPYAKEEPDALEWELENYNTRMAELNKREEAFAKALKDAYSVDVTQLDDAHAQALYMNLVEADPHFGFKDDVDGRRLFGAEAGTGVENLQRLLSLYTGVNPNSLYSFEAQQWLESSDTQKLMEAKRQRSLGRAAMQMLDSDQEIIDHHEKELMQKEDAVYFAGLMAGLSPRAQKWVLEGLANGELDESASRLLSNDELELGAQAFRAASPYADANWWLAQGWLQGWESTKGMAVGTWRTLAEVWREIDGIGSWSGTDKGYEEKQRRQLQIENAMSLKLDDSKLTFAGKMLSGVMGSLPYMAAMSNPVTGSMATMGMMNDVREEMILGGVDPDTALMVSVPVGITMALIEKMQFDALAGKGVTGLALRKMALTSLISELGKRNLKQAAHILKHEAKDVAVTYLCETTEEVLQQITNDLGVQYAKGDFNIRELAESAYETFVESTPTTLGFGLMRGTGLGPAIHRKLSPKRAAFEGLGEYMRARNVAENIVRNLDARLNGELVQEEKKPAPTQAEGETTQAPTQATTQVEGAQAEGETGQAEGAQAEGAQAEGAQAEGAQAEGAQAEETKPAEPKTPKSGLSERATELLDRIRKNWYTARSPRARYQTLIDAGLQPDQAALLDDFFEKEDAYGLDNPYFEEITNQVYYGDTRQRSIVLDEFKKRHGKFMQSVTPMDDGSYAVELKLGDGVTKTINVKWADQSEIRGGDTKRLVDQLRAQHDKKHGEGAWDKLAEDVRNAEVERAFTNGVFQRGKVTIDGHDLSYDGILLLARPDYARNYSGATLKDVGHEFWHAATLLAHEAGILGEAELAKLRKVFGEGRAEGELFNEEGSADAFGKWIDNNWDDAQIDGIFTKIRDFFRMIHDLIFGASPEKLSPEDTQISEESIFKAITRGDVRGIGALQGVYQKPEKPKATPQRTRTQNGRKVSLLDDDEMEVETVDANPDELITSDDAEYDEAFLQYEAERERAEEQARIRAQHALAQVARAEHAARLQALREAFAADDATIEALGKQAEADEQTAERVQRKAAHELEQRTKKRKKAADEWGKFYRDEVAVVSVDEKGYRDLPKSVKKREAELLREWRAARFAERAALERAAKAGVPGAREEWMRLCIQEKFNGETREARKQLAANLAEIADKRITYEWADSGLIRVLGQFTLESKSAFIKRRMQQFGETKSQAEAKADGLYPETGLSAPWINKELYGDGQGGTSPDAVAQALYDDGLINDPTPDALWAAIEADVDSVSKMKEREADAVHYNFDMSFAEANARRAADLASIVPLDAGDTVSRFSLSRRHRISENQMDLFDDWLPEAEARRQAALAAIQGRGPTPEERKAARERAKRYLTDVDFRAVFGFKTVKMRNSGIAADIFNQLLHIAETLDIPYTAMSLGGAIDELEFDTIRGQNSGDYWAHSDWASSSGFTQLYTVHRRIRVNSHPLWDWGGHTATLAHEWFHAFDNILSYGADMPSLMSGRGRHGKYLSEVTRGRLPTEDDLTNDATFAYYAPRQEIVEAFKELEDAISASDWMRHMRSEIKSGRKYYTSALEATARLFEWWISYRQHDDADYVSPTGYSNLGNKDVRYNPSREDVKALEPHLKNLFKTLKVGKNKHTGLDTVFSVSLLDNEHTMPIVGSGGHVLVGKDIVEAARAMGVKSIPVNRIRSISTDDPKRILGGLTRYAISNLYTGSAADYDQPSLHYVSPREGDTLYGWGLYASTNRKEAEKYAKRGDSQGNIYEQTFFTNRPDGDLTHILDWDSASRPRTLLKKIREGLGHERAEAFNREYSRQYRGEGGRPVAVYNGDIYKILSGILGSQKAASEFFRDVLDVDGFRYPVNAMKSRFWGDDSEGFNYVSFRDDNIRVDHKWVDGVQRYSVTAEMDADYRRAVEEDDLDLAGQMVREAAEAAGYKIVAYHGTRDDFNVFKPRTGGQFDPGYLGRGFYFSEDEETADWYAHRKEGSYDQMRVMTVGLKIDNLLVVPRSPMAHHKALQKELGIDVLSGTGITQEEAEALTQEVLRRGYDGVYREGPSTNTYVIYDSSRIKLLDPVTYDDNGNLIPLSKRFNQNRDDIRYSITADMKRNVDNLFVHFDEAKGKSRKEIFEQYDSTLKDVARLPFDMNFPEGLKVKNPVVKCAEAFFLDHVHNHKHEKEYTIEDYKRGFTLISPKNEMRIVPQQGSSSLAFIAKNPTSGWDCVVIAPKRGEFFIYKTMFGQKRKPYQDKPMVRFSISSRTSDSEPSASLYGEPSRQFAISENTHTISQSGENVKRKNSITAKPYNPRASVPKVRGGWTEAKILRYLKKNHSLTSQVQAAKLIAEFDSPEELKRHMFYHGTGNYVDRLFPSIIKNDAWAERHGGGGYGQRYWGISITKNKKVATNFGGANSRDVSVYPIILAKNAKVIERPDFSDAADIEDHIVDLWTQGVDAVWIGRKDGGEEELCVLNPRAICNVGTADHYRLYNLGGVDNPINIKDDNQIAKIYYAAKDYVENPPNMRFGSGPLKPSRFFRNPDGTLGELKPKEVYDADLAQYEKEIADWNASEQGRAKQAYMSDFRNTLRFSVTLTDLHKYADAHELSDENREKLVRYAVEAERFAEQTRDLWAHALVGAFPDEISAALATPEANTGKYPTISRVIAENFKRPMKFAAKVKGLKINSSEDVAAMMMAVRNPYQEMFKAIYLDDKNRVLDARVLTIGTGTQTLIDPQGVLMDIPDGAVSVIISHNHPTGVVNPSEPDKVATESLMRAVKFAGLELQDHVITNGNKYYSLKEGEEYYLPVDKQSNADWEITPLRSKAVLRAAQVADAAKFLRQDGTKAAVIYLDHYRSIAGVRLLPKDVFKKAYPKTDRFRAIQLFSAMGSVRAVIICAPFSVSPEVIQDLYDGCSLTSTPLLDIVQLINPNPTGGFLDYKSVRASGRLPGSVSKDFDAKWDDMMLSKQPWTRFSVNVRDIDYTKLPASLASVTTTTTIQHLSHGGHKDERRHDRAYAESLLKSLDGKKVAKGECILAKFHGDMDSASRVVNRVWRKDGLMSDAHIAKIRDLKAKLDPARPVVFLPILNEEGSDLNKLPHAYAAFLSKVLGGEINTDIHKTSKGANTNATGVECANREIAFNHGDTEIAQDAQIVIVDDVYTSGHTVGALVAFLRDKGLDVVAVSTLAASRYGRAFALTEKILQSAQRKSTLTSEQLKKEIGYGFENFTSAELQAYVTNKTVRSGKASAREYFGERVPGGAGGVRADESLNRAGQADTREVVGHLGQGTQRYTQETLNFPVDFSDSPNFFPNFFGAQKGTQTELDLPMGDASDGLRRYSVSFRDDYIDLITAVVANRRRAGKAVSEKEVADMLRGVNTDPQLARGVISTADLIVAENKSKLKDDIAEKAMSDKQFLHLATDAAKKRRVLAMTDRVGQHAYKLGREDAQNAQKLQAAKDKVAQNMLAAAEGFKADAMENKYGFNIVDTVANSMRPHREKLNKPEDPENKPGQVNGPGKPFDPAEEKEVDLPEPVEVEAPENAFITSINASAAQRADAIDEKYDLVGGTSPEQARENEDIRLENEHNAERAEEDEEKPEPEEEEGEAVDIEPEPIIKRERLDFKRASDFIAFIEVVVEKELRDRGSIRDGQAAFDSPVNIRELVNTTKHWLRKIAKELCASAGREHILDAIRKMDNATTLEAVECAAMNIYARIQERLITQSQKELVTMLEKKGKKLAEKGKRFSHGGDERDRKVRTEVEYWWRNIKRYFRMTPEAIQAELEALEQILDEREKIVETDESYNLHNDLQWQRAMDAKNALSQYGGLIRMRPAQIEEIANDILAQLQGSREELENAREDRRIEMQIISTRLQRAMVNPEAQAANKKPNPSWPTRMFDSMMGILEVRLRDLIRYSRGKVRMDAEADIQNVEDAIALASQGYHAYLVRQKDAFGQMLTALYGSSTEGMRRLTEILDDADRARITKQGAPEMTRAWLMQRYVELLQTDDYETNIALHKRDGKWRKEFDEVFSKYISTEDMKLITWFRDWYRSNLDEINEKVLLPISGIKQYSPGENYFPVKMLQNERMGYGAKAKTWSPYPNWLAPRVRHSLDFDERTNIIDMWYDRMKTGGASIHYAKLGVNLSDIFMRPEMKRTIKENHGDQALTRLTEHLMDIASGGGREIKSSDDSLAVADWLRGWQTNLTLSANFGSAFKQMLSCPVFALRHDINLGMVTKFMTDIDTSAIRDMLASDGWIARYGNGYSEAIQNAMAMNASGQRNTISNIVKSIYNAGFKVMEIGDAVPCLWCGQGLYRYFVSKLRDEAGNNAAMTEQEIREKAMTRTWAIIEMTQQSKRIENLTAAQRGGQLGRLLYQFMSSPLQQLSYEVQVIKEAYSQAKAYGGWANIPPKTKSQLYRTLVINHILMPNLMNLAAILVGLPLGAIPDREEVINTILISTLIGQFGCIFMAGAVGESAFRALITGKYDYRDHGLPVTGIVDLFEKLGVTAHDLLTLNVEDLKDDILGIIQSTSAPGRQAVKAYRNYIEGANKRNIESWTED